jgi:hypothetical protein
MLLQKDIDSINPDQPVTKYPLHKRLGLWLVCAVFCVAGWLLIINGFKAVRIWWNG